MYNQLLNTTIETALALFILAIAYKIYKSKCHIVVKEFLRNRLISNPGVELRVDSSPIVNVRRYTDSNVQS